MPSCQGQDSGSQGKSHRAASSPDWCLPKAHPHWGIYRHNPKTRGKKRRKKKRKECFCFCFTFYFKFGCALFLSIVFLCQRLQIFTQINDMENRSVLGFCGSIRIGFDMDESDLPGASTVVHFIRPPPGMLVSPMSAGFTMQLLHF